MSRKVFFLRVLNFAVVLVAALSLLTCSVFAQGAIRKALTSPAPPYPELAKKTHLTGVVKVQVVVAMDGRVREVKVLGGHPLLVDSVQETLKSWRYAMANTESTLILTFNFNE